MTAEELKKVAIKMLHPKYSPEHRGNIVTENEAIKAIDFASLASCPITASLTARIEELEKELTFELSDASIESALLSLGQPISDEHTSGARWYRNYIKIHRNKILSKPATK